MHNIRVLKRSVAVFSYPYKGIFKFKIEIEYSKIDQLKFVQRLCSTNFTRCILLSPFSYTLLQLKEVNVSVYQI